MPRQQPHPHVEWSFDEKLFQYLAVPREVPTTPLVDVIERRRSSRGFGDLDQASLARVLWYSSRTKRRAVQTRRWEHRGTPSAGGLHPIDIVIQDWDRHPGSLFRYEPKAHALMQITPANVSGQHHLREVATACVGRGGGTVLWYAAQFSRTRAHYELADSLVWRDAGALLATMALVAELLELACCPLGVTGEPHLSRVLKSGDAVVGVGGCVIGSRVE